MKKLVLALLFLGSFVVFASADSWNGGSQIIINQSTTTATYGNFSNATINNLTFGDGSVLTSTSPITTLQAQVTSVAVSTGAIQSSLNRVILSTGALQLQANNIAISTGSTQNQLNGIYSTTSTWSAPQTFTSSMTVNNSLASNTSIKTPVIVWASSPYTVGVTTPSASDVTYHTTFIDSSNVIWTATGSATCNDYIRQSR